MFLFSTPAFHWSCQQALAQHDAQHKFPSPLSHFENYQYVNQIALLPVCVSPTWDASVVTHPLIDNPAHSL